MSELNDFFAKKDRRRKKPSKAGKSSSSSDSGLQGPEYPSNVDNSGSNITNFSGNPQAQPTKTSKGDDGWIDIEDPKTARVNTGGKTIEEFKRDHDDKEQNGNEDTPSEKFTGWAKTAESDSTGESLKEVAATPVAAFPSLADTADAPEVPVTRGPRGEAPSSGSSARPRFTNSKLAAGLKKMLEQNASTGTSEAPKPAGP